MPRIDGQLLRHGIRSSVTHDSCNASQLREAFAKGPDRWRQGYEHGQQKKLRRDAPTCARRHDKGLVGPSHGICHCCDGCAIYLDGLSIGHTAIMHEGCVDDAISCTADACISLYARHSPALQMYFVCKYGSSCLCKYGSSCLEPLIVCCAC